MCSSDLFEQVMNFDNDEEMQKKEDMHKMAEANKAFAHYRF